MQLRDFVEGEGYTYREMAVAAGYQSKPGGNFERGIVLAPKDMPSAIMIKMNLAKGLYDDSFREGADHFYYIGDGLPRRGHQRLVYGNKIMVENQDLPVYLFMRYEGERKGSPWTFKGSWRITGIERDYISTREVEPGTPQRVFRFKLTKAVRLDYENEIFEQRRDSLTPPSESDYIRATPALLKVIEPRHNKLANHFRKWLVEEGFQDIRLEQNQIDVVFKHKDVSYMSELKVVHNLTTTKLIREAMGQVMEYNYFNSRNPYDKWLIVLEQEPSESDVDYIRRLERNLNTPLNLGWQQRKQFDFIEPLN
jgi:hypothetical protein